MTKREITIDDKRLADSLRDNLLDQERETSSGDLFRLAQARKKALSQSRQSNKRFLWPALGTSFASVALIAVLISPTEQPLPSGDMSMTEIQVDEPLLDLYEDLDFYDWLASAET